MKQFYLLRHEDVHGHSGEGVVAEGIIFDNGLCAMTWLSEFTTVTMFQNIVQVETLHSHGGKTQVVVENRDGQFRECKAEARRIRSLRRKELEKKAS